MHKFSFNIKAISYIAILILCVSLVILYYLNIHKTSVSLLISNENDKVHIGSGLQVPLENRMKDMNDQNNINVTKSSMTEVSTHPAIKEIKSAIESDETSEENKSFLKRKKAELLERSNLVKEVCEKFNLKSKERFSSSEFMVDDANKLAYCRHGKVGLNYIYWCIEVFHQTNLIIQSTLHIVNTICSSILFTI